MQNNQFVKIEESGKKEIMAAVFVIAFVSMFVLANFFIGFNLPIYLAVMIPAVLLAFLHPRSGLYAIVFLTFIFERFFTLAPVIMGRTEYKIYPLDVIMLAVVFGIVLSFLKGKLEIKFEKTDLFVMLFMLLSVVYGISSIFFLGNEAGLSFSSAKNYAFYAVLYFIASVLIKSKKDFFYLAGFVVSGGIAILGFLAYGMINGEGLWSQYTPLSTEGIRILAFTHAFYISMLFVFASAYLFLDSKKSFYSNFFTILLPLWAIGIIGSMMRHLWISLAMALLIVFVLTVKKIASNAKQIAITYLITICIVLISTFYFSSILPNSNLNASIESMTGIVERRITSIGDSSDESIFWRNVVWREALKKYAENPLFGAGFGEYVSVEIGTYKDFVEVRNIHNSFLVLLTQMGVFGILLFVYPILVLIRDVFSRLKEDDGLHIARIASVGILALHLIAFVFQPYLEANLLGIFFWINLGLMRSLGQENIKTRRDKNCFYMNNKLTILRA